MLPRTFYDRPTLVVARAMLGKALVHLGSDGVRRAGRIVETEAYLGQYDAASHARSGPTGRAAIMFGPPGYAYVYLIYGVYHCFNAVTEGVGSPAAVLIRALAPLDGLEGERTSGPGLLCRALRLDRSATGLDLTASELFLEDGPPVADAEVVMGPRVGVEFAGAWAHKPWRFWVGASPWVSRTRRGEPFRRQVLVEDAGRTGAAGRG